VLYEVVAVTGTLEEAYLALTADAVEYRSRHDAGERPAPDDRDHSKETN
jgi:hypothetical protein